VSVTATHYPNLHAEHYSQTVNTMLNLDKVLQEEHLYQLLDPVFLPDPSP